jgi:hypothetical protein
VAGDGHAQRVNSFAVPRYTDLARLAGCYAKLKPCYERVNEALCPQKRARRPANAGPGALGAPAGPRGPLAGRRVRLRPRAATWSC